MKVRFDSRRYSLHEVIEYGRARRPNKKGCILWMRAVNTWGYPQINHGGRMVLATRFLLERKLGRPLRRGMLALHKCNNPRCVNAGHLYEGTSKQNSLDRNRRNEGHGYKLTYAIARRIRRAKKVKGTLLARRYGVSQSLISLIRHNKIWIE